MLELSLEHWGSEGYFLTVRDVLKPHDSEFYTEIVTINGIKSVERVELSRWGCATYEITLYINGSDTEHTFNVDSYSIDEKLKDVLVASPTISKREYFYSRH